MVSNSWSLSFLRRGFSLSSIVLCSYNTISSLQNAVYLMSVTRPWPHTLVESQYMELRTYSDENLNDQVGWAFWSCDDENGKEIHPHPIVNCPVTFANNSPYLAFMVVWAGYFLVLFLYHFYQCMQYPVTDLRYYINLINAENNKYHKRYIIAGINCV